MSKETKTYTVLWTETITNIATVEAKSDADLYSKWSDHTYQDQHIETSDYNEGSFQVLRIDNKPIN